MRLRSYQSDAVKAVLAEYEAGGQSTLVVMPTGCHRAGTPIMLSSGIVMPVEGIYPVRDKLMGPDGTARRILSLVRGEGQMYEITPTKGDPFVVDENHVLTLVRTNEDANPRFPSQNRGGEIVDVTVKEWVGWSKWKKHIHKLFRVPIDDFGFRGRPPIDPYFIGVLLGDGHLNHQLAVTTADREMISEIHRFAKSWSMGVRSKPAGGKSNSYFFTSGRVGCKGTRLHQELVDLSMRRKTAGFKSIPLSYKIASRNNRLQLLAGLIDTDGHLREHGSGYEYSSKSIDLANDVAFVSRSLGLSAYVSINTEGYYRVSISGDVDMVPVRISRKKANARRQKKSVLRTGFTARKLGIEPFYGFVVDGDQRYLLGDFTVTHNCGKTVVFAHMIASMAAKGRALVIAHREELILQARAKIAAVTGHMPDIEMADQWADQSSLHGKAPVIVSSIQTQCAGRDGGRMTRFNPKEFGLIVIDECHHAPADSYKRMIAHYTGGNPDIKVLGVTATPDRADEEALGQVFESAAYVYEIVSAINDGWLVPISQRQVVVGGLDLSKVHTQAGDLNQKELAAIMEAEGPLHQIAYPTIDIIGDRKTLVFASSVKHAEQLAEIFNRHRAGSARWICGETNRDIRQRTIREYTDGTFQIMVNVGVFTEGFDEPGVQVVAIARPTKSRSLYSQMVGRGTRPLPGLVDGVDSADERRARIAASAKPSVEIIDFVGNSGRHKLVCTTDILGGNYSDDVLDRAKKIAADSDQPTDTLSAIAKAEKEIAEEREAAQRRLEENARKHVKPAAKYVSRPVDPFDVLDLTPWRERGWEHGKKPSEQQVAFLTRNGINTEGMTFAQAKQITADVTERYRKRLATPKQAGILKKYGYDTHCSREAAASIITTLQNNRWRAPQPAITEF